MAEMVSKLEVKVIDLDCFKGLVDALAQWAGEAQTKEHMSDAENNLYRAAVGITRVPES
jgi:hypothetical protein